MEAGLDDTPVFNPRSSQNYSRVNNVSSISDKVSFKSSVDLGAGHLKRSCNWTGMVPKYLKQSARYFSRPDIPPRNVGCSLQRKKTAIPKQKTHSARDKCSMSWAPRMTCQMVPISVTFFSKKNLCIYLYVLVLIQFLHF